MERRMKHDPISQYDLDRADERAGLLSHFRKRRALSVSRYLTASLWEHRRRARSDALHYGRLARQMERMQ